MRRYARGLGWPPTFAGAEELIMRRWFFAALVLLPIGGADAHSPHNQNGPVMTICHWGGTVYSLGGYCTPACSGAACGVEVCLGQEQWINMGPCRGYECSRAC